MNWINAFINFSSQNVMAMDHIESLETYTWNKLKIPMAIIVIVSQVNIKEERKDLCQRDNTKRMKTVT